MAVKGRRVLHVWAADGLHYSGLLTAWRTLSETERRKRRGVCVLGFHRILSAEEYASIDSLPGMVMKESTFSELLAYLKARFRVINVDEFRSAHYDSSKPSCLLTFDDGWKDNYTRAYPWLVRYGLPAIIFIATGFIGVDREFWVEALIRASKNPANRILTSAAEIAGGQEASSTLEGLIEWLKRMPTENRKAMLDRLLPANSRQNGDREAPSMLNWDEVMEMSRGGIDFGTHTVTHPLLPYEDERAVEWELRESKQVLETKLGKSIVAFAYPNGDWNASVRQHIQKAGYRYSFTTRTAWYQRGSDPYTIPRILLHEGSITGLDGRFSPAMLNLLLARAGRNVG